MKLIDNIRQALARKRRAPDNADEILAKREELAQLELRRLTREREDNRRRLQIARDLAKARKPD